MPKFTFDVKMFVTVTLTADDETTARVMLRECIDGNEANLGAWPNGDPIVGTIGMDGRADLIDVDGNTQDEASIARAGILFTE